jgi:hypothetical protein
MSMRSDSGIAMISALLAMMVMTSLAVGSFAVAAHNSDSSAQDRRRTQAIHAAEAGIDRFLSYLESAPVSGTACSLASESLSTTPPSSFAVTVTYHPTPGDPTVIPCPPSVAPGDVVIRSVGTSAGVSRTMEGDYLLVTTPGGTIPFSGAIYSDSTGSWSGSSAITASPGPYGADVYSNSDYTLSGNAAVFGSVLSQGAITLSGSTDVKQNATAHLGVTLSGSADVRADAQSGTAGVSTSGSAKIWGNAKYCTGSAPQNTVGAKTQVCDSTVPTAKPWSQVQRTYVVGDWQGAGYAINTFSDPNACTNALSFLTSNWSGKQVVYINSTCTLSLSGNTTVNLNGDLAVISNGALSLSGSTGFNSASAHTLYLWFNMATARPCSSNGISFSGNSSLSGSLTSQLYTPCKVNFSGGTFGTGQIIGGQVTFSGNAGIVGYGVTDPGTSQAGFVAKMVYKREVI